MPRLDSLLPLLHRARQSLDRTYEAFVKVAKYDGGIPCDAVSVYTRLRREVLRLEGALIVEARKRNLHPPEDVPRSFALLGACAPGAGEVRLDKEQIALGETYVAQVKARAKQSAQALRAAYEASPEFAAHARGLLEYIAPYAKAGTEEVAPAPPQNLPLLFLLYYAGGTIWPIQEAEAFWRLELAVVDRRDAETVYREAAVLEQAAVAFEEEATPPPPILPWYGWLGLGLGSAAAAGGLIGIGLHWERKPGRGAESEAWPDLPSGEDEAPATETGR